MLLLDKTANNVKGFRAVKFGLAVLVIAASVSALAPKEKKLPDWQVFSMAKYHAAMENHQRMVIIFHADWCIPCRELDEWTFSDSGVIDQLGEYRVLRVDMTHAMNERVTQIRKMFDIVGMPTIIVTDANGETVEKITGFISADAFRKIISGS
jgi:thiol:disulfide interchange protein DsbD